MNDYAKHPDIFTKRHVGPSDDDVISMLGELGFSSMSEFINNVIPDSIAFDSTLKVGDGVSEQEAIKILKSYASKNKVFKSFLGNGYHGTITPGVIKRNILENPAGILNIPLSGRNRPGSFRSIVEFPNDDFRLTGMDIANASLLDEATAAAEAMSMACNA